MNASFAAALVRRWVELYTRGVPAAVRAARRDEVDDDLWCQGEEAAPVGRAPRSVGAEMLLRLLLGIPADVSWRLSHGGRRPASGSERSSSMSTRVIGALAVIGGASWGISAVLVLAFGDSVWTGSDGAVVGAFGVGGSLMFAAATLGLVWRFQDQVSPLGALGGVLAGFGAIVGTLGGYAAIFLLPIGSAVLAWELARAGILPRTMAIVQALSALAFLGPLISSQIDYEATIRSAWVVALALPYMLTWIAIGASLLRGVPPAHEPAAGT